jgi:5-methylcytosine-specific restriction endonuclease McrA
MIRTKNMYYNTIQRARAASATIPYTLSQFRAHVDQALQGPCPHCGQKLTASNFSGDHKLPLSRSGTWELDNLEITCYDCNRAKSNLTRDEFAQLLSLLATWPPDAAKSTIRRLKLGAKAAGFRN